MGFWRQECWSGLPFPSPVAHTLSDLSTATRPSRLAPHARLSLTELDKAVVLWADWLVFCDCGFSASALWCPLTTPTVLIGFSYLGRGVSPQGRPSWPWTRSISSRPSHARAGAAPWMWGCSSRPRFCTVLHGHRVFQAGFRRGRGNQRSNCQHPLDHQSRRVPEKHLSLLYWSCQSFWLCGSQ